MLIKSFKIFEGSKSNTQDFKAPEYLVEPAKNDKGFFMFKAQFDALKSKKDKNKKKYSPSISWKFADE